MTTPTRHVDLLAQLPPEWPDDLLPAIRQRVAASRRKVVVVDDDPTGTQTVYDVAVLTVWDVDALAAELNDPAPMFYVSTNSRSYPREQAEAINVEIGRNLVRAARETGRDFAVISRSDSTLRGHFPAEPLALERGLERRFDGWVLIPFFLEGGRFTIDNIHYAREGDTLIPAGETPFARDSAFGYVSSNLREWVAEKTGGRVAPTDVAVISLDDIRRGGPAAVYETLMGLRDGTICAVNAASYRDLDVVTLALLDAEAQGKRFLCRTAASFARARAGLAERGLLEPGQLALAGETGGLVIVGSHVPISTAQLDVLLRGLPVVDVEVRVDLLLDEQTREAEIERVAAAVEGGIRAGQDVVVYTSRQLITGQDAAHSLAIGKQISDGLVAAASRVQTAPRFIVAKGGITSSDIASRALGIRRAIVLGQIAPGVPVWEPGGESRFPGVPYVVFPGNVGKPETLLEVVTALRAGKTPHA